MSAALDWLLDAYGARLRWSESVTRPRPKAWVVYVENDRTGSSVAYGASRDEAASRLRDGLVSERERALERAV